MNAPYFEGGGVRLFHGDCIEVMRELPDGSVHAVVTDPPYGLEFMGREWDGADGFRRSLNAADAGRDSVFGRTSSTSPEYRADVTFQEWCTAWAREALRVLKPGGHLLAFGGSRTWHRLAAGVEDAGFEIRDSIAWLYGSGFPKSMDVSKAIDRGQHVARSRALRFTEWMRSTGITAATIQEATGTSMASHYLTAAKQPEVATAEKFDLLRPYLPEVPEEIERLVAERSGIAWPDYVARGVVTMKTPATVYGDEVTKVLDHGDPQSEESLDWAGWGTALKPAFEPIVVARKPLVGTVAANVLTHGTGALNIEGTRVPMSDADAHAIAAKHAGMDVAAYERSAGSSLNLSVNPMPLKAAKPHEAGRWPTNVVLDESQAAVLDEQSGRSKSPAIVGRGGKRGATQGASNGGSVGGFNLRGGASVPGYDDEGGASRFFPVFRYEAKAPTSERPRAGEVSHPTVKPLDLMRWLVRLVTPPGGVVLEPFAGSGTTAEACVREGFGCIAIEREADYLPLIVKRLSKDHQQSLFGDWEDAS